MKTRLYTRKRALISSVAMLLVAMIALGTATFAWFTANPKSDASGLSLKTTASAGLVVRTDSDYAWSHDASLYKGQADVFNLTPVSQEQATPGNIWTIDAAKSNEYDALSTGTMSPASWGGPTSVAASDESPSSFDTGAAYKEKVYFRLSDGSNPDDAAGKAVKLTGVTITKATGATMENAIRVAVADKSGALIGNYALSSAGSHGTLTTADKTEGTFSPAIATTVATPVTCPTASLTANAADLNNYVTVYVYLDGQDSICTSDNVGTVNAAKIISSIKLSFELMNA